MIPACRRPTARLAVDPRQPALRTITDSHQPLRVFICSVANDVFMICAKNSGVAWSVVMDRYRVQHPSALPTPRHLHAVPMVLTPEPEDMRSTKQCDMRVMARVTGGTL